MTPYSIPTLPILFLSPALPSDATMKLRQVPPGKQDYREFLGRDQYLPRIQQMDLTTCAAAKLAFFLNGLMAALVAAFVLI